MPASTRTLGAYLRQPGVADRIAARRAEALVRVTAALTDQAERTRITRALTDLVHTTTNGRRYDVIARDLRALADQCDRIPGWIATAA